MCLCWLDCSPRALSPQTREVMLDTETLLLKDASGKKREGLYAVGELTKGQWLAAGNITLAADQAGCVAGAMAERLRRAN